MDPSLFPFADSPALRGNLAIVGAVLFLVFGVYGLILVAYTDPKTRTVDPSSGEIPRSNRVGGLSVRAIVTIVGLGLGFVVLALSGC